LSSSTCSMPRYDPLPFLSSSSVISIHTLFRALDRCSAPVTWPRCDVVEVPRFSSSLPATGSANHGFPQAVPSKKMDILPLYPRSADPAPGSSIESLSAYAGARGPVQTFRTA